jgi:integrase
MKHVDLEKKEIRIERAWDINTREFHEPKTRAGIRRVDIMDPLTEILRQYFVCYPVAGRDSLLFPSITEATQPVSYNSIFGVFKRSLKKAELPDVTIHSLRHTYASIMLSVGASVNTLARHLGHSSPQITFRIYSHEISENLGDALDRASKLITAARATNVGEPREPRHT